MTLSADPRIAYTLEDLLLLMARLRHPENGCPWDLKQNFRSIVPSTIEEAYEVAEAIESDDYAHLKEELGDLLFQIVFYSQLANEQSLFDFAAVVDTLTAKLLRRHPHVFPDGSLASEADTRAKQSDDVKLAWEAIKQTERDNKGMKGLLDDVPLGLPALSRAAKLQKRAANVGFDWDNPVQVLEKVEEELSELRSALKQNDHSAQTEEFGDLLFSLVNLSRHLKLDAEAALRAANRKFVDRFAYIEERMSEQGLKPSAEQRDVMEVYWEQSKRR